MGAKSNAAVHDLRYSNASEGRLQRQSILGNRISSNGSALKSGRNDLFRNNGACSNLGHGGGNVLFGGGCGDGADCIIGSTCFVPCRAGAGTPAGLVSSGTTRQDRGRARLPAQLGHSSRGAACASPDRHHLSTVRRVPDCSSCISPGASSSPAVAQPVATHRHTDRYTR